MLIMERVIESKGISAKAFAVLEGIKEGLSVKKSAMRAGWQDGYFYKEMYDNPILEKSYLRARENRSHSHYESVSQICEDMRFGVIDSAIARVELEATKWMASMGNRRIYAEKQIPDVQVNISLAGALDAAIALRDAVPVISAPEVIEAEIVPDKRAKIAESLL